MKKIKKLLLAIPLTLLLFGCSNTNSGSATDNTTTAAITTTNNVANTEDEIVMYSFDEEWFEYFEGNTYYDLELKKAVVKFNDNGYETLLFHYSGNWICYEKIIKDYDDNKLTNIEIYDYSDKDKEWYGIKKITYEYDEYGDVDERIEYIWSEEKNDWERGNGIRVANNILSAAKNILLEMAASPSSNYVSNNTDLDYRKVIQVDNYTLYVTKEALEYFGEIDVSNINISGKMKVYYSLSNNKFTVELNNLVIDGQRIKWDSESQEFYK